MSAEFICTRCSSTDPRGKAKGICRQCYQREYHAKHREQMRAQSHARYWSDPDKARAEKRASTAKNIEAVRARCRAWHQAHKPQLQAYRTENLERYNAAMRRWRKANPDKCRARNLRTKAKRRQNEIAAISETFTRQEIYQRDNGVCWLCKKPVDPTNWHLDHIRPLARGGQHTRANSAVSHPFCNLSKGHKIITP